MNALMGNSPVVDRSAVANSTSTLDLSVLDTRGKKDSNLSDAEQDDGSYKVCYTVHIVTFNSEILLGSAARSHGRHLLGLASRLTPTRRD